MSRAHNDVGGDSFQIRDCHVWAAIYDLDSPTDYREYLSQGSPATTPRPIGEELIMLDAKQTSVRLAGWHVLRRLKLALYGLLLVLFLVSLLSGC